jgi:coproporphyrinogen III oxidase-like Fe-S oxidoreductase
VKTGWFLRGVRDHLIGERGRYRFEPTRSVDLPAIPRLDLYLHIPFCRSLCPYCPYNRILYNKSHIAPYLAAVLAEIDTYHARLGRIEIGSVYIGGGTPTTMLNEIGQILAHLRKRFLLTGEIAIETIPNDLDDESLRKLKDLGITLLSIGVQSFDERYLKLMGRNYQADILMPVITKAISAGFESVNLDMMFALPGQTTAEALVDLNRIFELGADQVTLYPLFTFPYTAVGKHRAFQHVKFPKMPVRRQMYRALHDYALAKGFSRVSVWGFKRGEVPRFSSVTRQYYIGLGAGSASCLPGMFYFNTFSVSEYSRTCTNGDTPVALKMAMTSAMEHYYWLYWRLYDTYVPKHELMRIFQDDTKIKWLLMLARKMGMMTEEKDHYVLTERGAFWIHLLQNHYVLNYIDKVWSTAIKEPWPGRITL